MNLPDGRVVLSGAAGGMGRAFCLRLVEAGAAVVAGDTDAAGLRRLRREAEGLPGRLTVDTLDVTDEAGVVDFMAAAADELGSPNVLLNCAGILGDGLVVGRDDDGGLRRLPAAVWRRALDVNLTGSFLLTREWVFHALDRGVDGGVAVHLSSLSRRGNPGQAAYAASKAGLDAATRSWALELARHGIRVAAVAPGVVETPFLGGISGPALERLMDAVPLRRAATTDEVWEAVRFVLECDYFTGRVLEVDGGAGIDVATETRGSAGGEAAE